MELEMDHYHAAIPLRGDWDYMARKTKLNGWNLPARGLMIFNMCRVIVNSYDRKWPNGASRFLRPA
jgi:hypothetical protein